MSHGTEEDQLALPGLPSARRTQKRSDPVVGFAKVLVETPAAHLDDVYDYAVTEALDEHALPGRLVRVRFRSELTGGYILDRDSGTSYAGRIEPLQRVVTPLEVLRPDVLATARRVQQAYGGSLIDVVRLAVPPRHARAEADALATTDPPAAFAAPSPVCGAGVYPALEAFTARSIAGDAPAAALTYLPGVDDDGTPMWARTLAELLVGVAARGGSVIGVAADARHLALLRSAVGRLVPEQAIAVLSAQAGPAQRFGEFARCLSGAARIVLGTRSAVWAPVDDLRLIAVTSSEGPGLEEPRSPYPHAVHVAMLRAQCAGAGFVVGDHVPSLATAAGLLAGPLKPVRPAQGALMAARPRVVVFDDDTDPVGGRTRFRTSVVRAMRDGVQRGPVLVQVPRRGETPRVRCGSCGAEASCPRCSRPLTTWPQSRQLRCLACDGPSAGWACAECGSGRWRASSSGVPYASEDVGRLVPGARVVMATAAQRVVELPRQGGVVVVATPGAEPVVAGGYAVVVIADPVLMWDRAHPGADVEALRAWSGAVGLAASARESGLVVFGEGDPQGLAESVRSWSAPDTVLAEAEQWRAVGLPPVVASLVVRGDRRVVAAFRDELVPRIGGVAVGTRTVSAAVDPGLLDDRDETEALVTAPPGGPPGEWPVVAAREATALRRAWLAHRRKPPTVVLRPTWTTS